MSNPTFTSRRDVRAWFRRQWRALNGAPPTRGQVERYVRTYAIRHAREAALGHVRPLNDEPPPPASRPETAVPTTPEPKPPTPMEEP